MLRNRLLTRRKAFLLSMGAMGSIGTLGIGRFRYLRHQLQERNFTVVRGTSLGNQAASKGLIYGAASGYHTLTTDVKLAASFVRECSILVPENDLKWRTLRPSPNHFNFSPGDWLAKFACDRGILFRGHTLVWHEALPKWFQETVNSRNAEQFLVNHIKTVAGHYAGQMHSWDVVNEAIDPSDGRSDGLRETPWLEFLGPDYIDVAFHAAAKADPKALLVYNDYGLDYSTRDNEAKRVAVLKLLERLKSRGTPVHALGIQAHLSGHKGRFNARKLKDFMRDVADLGLKILITELDVTDQKLPRDVLVRDRIVAGVYEDYLSVVLDEPAVVAVLTWGLSDKYTWLSKYKPLKDGAPVRPLPLDAQLNRKLAWNAIARAFAQAPTR